MANSRVCKRLRRRLRLTPAHITSRERLVKQRIHCLPNQWERGASRTSSGSAVLLPMVEFKFARSPDRTAFTALVILEATKYQCPRVGWNHDDLQDRPRLPGE